VTGEDPGQRSTTARTRSADAVLILRLLLEKRFPRIWTRSSEGKDLGQRLIHRHKLVRIRAQVKNELQHWR